jgi:hypothetical protein
MLKRAQLQRTMKRIYQHKETTEETMVMILMMWDIYLVLLSGAVADQFSGFRAQAHEGSDF